MRLTLAIPRPTAILAGAVALIMAGGILIACGADHADTSTSLADATSPTAAPTTSAPTAASASRTASPSTSPSSRPTTAAGWPNAQSTGVRPGTVLKKRSGEIIIQKSGTVIENMDLVGAFRVEANNVTIRNVRITNIGYDEAKSTWAIVLWEGYTGLVVENVDIVGSKTTEMLDGIASLGGKITVRYCDISGISKKAVDTSRGLVEENYLHDPNNFKAADGEVDMVRVTGGPGAGERLVVRHNTILNSLDATSAAGIYSDSGHPAHDILFEDNFLGGGGYTLYAGGEDDPTYNLVIRRNVFSTKLKGSYGPVVFFNRRGKGNVWQNNTWQNGATVRV